jgi:hypothetical protein
MTAISTSGYASTALNVSAQSSGVFYERNATNVLDATASDAVDLGTVTTNGDAAHVEGEVLEQNGSDYYKFNLNGSSMKLAFNNYTGSSTLRVRIYNSTGYPVADSQGTAAQQAAFTAMTSSSGYKTTAGEYTVQVTYGGTSDHSVPQKYGLSVFSGTQFTNMNEVVASAQTDSSQNVAVDNTMTYATSDAASYTTKAYNKLNATASTAVNIGWLSENKSALSVTSQLSEVDSTDYYSFTFEQGSALKLAFNNQTTAADATGVRVQLLDVSGTDVIADNEGTAAQQAAYASLTSSTGLDAQTGSYVVKVSYAADANKTQAQTYNFDLYSGDTYENMYATTASAQTFSNAYYSGTWASSLPYSSASAAASGVYSQMQDSLDGVLSVLAAEA